MDVLILQVFVSLVLVFGSLILFAVSTRQRDHEHADRLALLPLEDDDVDEVDEAEVRRTKSNLPRNTKADEPPGSSIPDRIRKERDP